MNSLPEKATMSLFSAASMTEGSNLDLSVPYSNTLISSPKSCDAF